MMQKSLSAIRKIIGITEPFPRLVQIEITNVCNLSCRMCVRNFISIPRRHMDWEVFTSVVARLRGARTVTLTGYGEPLLHPRIFDAIALCRNQGLETQLTTNALLLDTDRARKALLDSGIGTVTFSVESVRTRQDEIGHPNQDALQNIALFLEMRRRHERKSPAVTLQTIMIRGLEQDLFDVVRWGAKQQVDRINVVRFDLNTLSDIQRPGVAEERELFRELGRLRKKLGVRIDCIQDQFFSGAAGLAYRLGKGLLGLDRRCIRIQDFCYVGVDGRVRPCCALAGHELGSLLESPMEKIWRSDIYANFRKKHDKIPWCRRCDTFTLRQKG